MTPFATQEPNHVIKQSNRRTAADTRGVSAEMIKHPTRRVENMCYDCATTSSNLTKNHHRAGVTRQSKSRTRAEIRHRHRELLVHLCDPIVYKLSCKLLLKRLQSTLDQANFTPSHSTTSHLYTFQQLRQRAALEGSKALKNHSCRCPQSERQCTPDVKSKQLHLKRRTKQRERPCFSDASRNRDLHRQTTFFSPAIHSNTRPSY